MSRCASDAARRARSTTSALGTFGPPDAGHFEAVGRAGRASSGAIAKEAPATSSRAPDAQKTGLCGAATEVCDFCLCRPGHSCRFPPRFPKP